MSEARLSCHPMLVVTDVAASSAWYQELLGLESAHGGVHFEMLMAGEALALTLHHPEIERHPVIPDPRQHTTGAGLLLYFTVDDVQPVFERAVAMGVEVYEEPHENEVAHAIEFSVRDPDGYAITVSQRMG